jgi:chorismate mutase
MHLHPNPGVEELERLQALDALDQDLLDAVRDRIRCCVRIAPSRHLDDAAAADRERAAAYARMYGIDAEFLDCLYDLIIDETCRVEDLVISGDDG